MFKALLKKMTFGKAGTPSPDVLTIQGIVGGTGVNVTAIGTPSDAAWSGTGDATVISLLKKIATNTNA